jgi:hypothetical protein
MAVPDRRRTGYRAAAAGYAAWLCRAGSHTDRSRDCDHRIAMARKPIDLKQPLRITAARRPGIRSTTISGLKRTTK